jgi:hypothetical protein
VRSDFSGVGSRIGIGCELHARAALAPKVRFALVEIDGAEKAEDDAAIEKGAIEYMDHLYAPALLVSLSRKRATPIRVDVLSVDKVEEVQAEVGWDESPNTRIARGPQVVDLRIDDRLGATLHRRNDGVDILERSRLRIRHFNVVRDTRRKRPTPRRPREHAKCRTFVQDFSCDQAPEIARCCSR